MSLPPNSPPDGFYPQDAGAQPAMVWGPPPIPSWSPAWQQPSFPAPFPGGPQAGPLPRMHSGSPWLLGLVAFAALLTGAAGAGFLAMVLFVSGAEDIGRGIGEEFALSIEADGGMSAYSGSGPVEEFPAVAPGTLGPDPVLDAYAASCFDGELVACDDLYFESPPMSDYEEYAGTCGGRVKLFAVMSCTELE
jgi:hypothetical protein